MMFGENFLRISVKIFRLFSLIFVERPTQEFPSNCHVTLGDRVETSQVHTVFFFKFLEI